MRRKSHRGRLSAYLSQPQRVGLTLKESQQTQAVGQRADERAFLVGDSRSDELFDRPTLTEHAERGVPCARDLPSLIHDALKDGRAVQLGRQRHARDVERTEPNRLLPISSLQGREAQARRQRGRGLWSVRQEFDYQRAI